MLAYLTYMAERLEHMNRLLKLSGSIYLHCDDAAVHYLKILMDAIFGADKFLNDIVWKRATSHNDSKRYGRITDHILFYAKSSDKNLRFWDGDSIANRKSDEELRKAYPLVDESGRHYRSENVTGAGITERGESGRTWRGYEVSEKGRHWAPPKKSSYAQYIETNFIENYQQIEGVHDRLNALDKAGLIHHPQEGKWPGLVRYAGADKGNLPQNLILEPVGFTNFNANRGEYLGYPTQKPVDLLDKLVLASCPVNGVVLDPFCGCGTTIVSAGKLGRKWIGIDISSFAIDLIKKKRLQDFNIPTKGIPYDFASARRLKEENPFNFESWAINRLSGFVPNAKQVSDGGVDGRATLAYIPDDFDSRLGLAQVKGGSGNLLGGLRDFLHVSDRDRAAVSCFITMNEFSSREAIKEAAEHGKIHINGHPYQRMHLWSIEHFFEKRFPNLPLMNDPYTGKPIQPTLFEAWN